MKALLTLHERYPDQRARVVRANTGKVGTVSLSWDAYVELLQLVLRADAAVFANLVREVALELEQDGPVKGLSKKVTRAVRARLAKAVQ